MSEERERRPREELAPALERVEHWARELIWMCREHERTARLVNATAWFIAPMSRPLDELAAALNDLQVEQKELVGATPDE